MGRKRRSRVDRLRDAINEAVSGLTDKNSCVMAIIVNDREENFALCQYGMTDNPLFPLKILLGMDDSERIFMDITENLPEKKIDALIEILRQRKQSFIELRKPKPCYKCARFIERSRHFGDCIVMKHTFDGEEIHNDCEKFQDRY